MIETESASPVREGARGNDVSELVKTVEKTKYDVTIRRDLNIPDRRGAGGKFT